MIARVWRDGDDINFVVPFPTILHTYMALFTTHSALICHLVDELADMISPTTLGTLPDASAILQLKAIMLANHDSEPITDNRLKVGTPNEFPGMVYGTMAAWELGVLAIELSTAIKAVKDRVPETSKAISAVEPWIVATELLTDAEIQSSLASTAAEGGKV